LISIHASHAEIYSVEEARKAVLSDTPDFNEDARLHPRESLADVGRMFSRFVEPIGQGLLICSRLRFLVGCHVPVGIGAFLLILGGCSEVAPFGLTSQWREGVAILIVRRDAIPDGTSMQCISSTANSDATPRDALFVIVRMRIGRAPFDEAFGLPQGAVVRTGDVVRVQPRSCLLRDTYKAGASDSDRTAPMRSQ